MLVLDRFQDALRRRGVAVLAALESRRASLSDSVSPFGVSLLGSALVCYDSLATGLQATGLAWLAYIY